MFNWKDFEKFRHIFSASGDQSYRAENGQHHISVRPKDLLRWIDLIRDDLGYLTLVDLAAVDFSLKDELKSFRFEMVYHFLNMGNHQRVNLHLHFDEAEVVPSIAPFYLHAEWMEREQSEMFGIKFNISHPSLILPRGQTLYPLRKDAVIGEWGPDALLTKPAIRFNPNKSETPYPEEAFVWKEFSVLDSESMGLFDWMVCFDPQKIVTSHLRVGMHHQGFEKILESKSWIQILQLVDKLNLGAAPTYATAWAKTIEDSFRIKVPERTQAIRIVLLELARIADHLTVIAETVMALGKDEFRLFVDAREKVYELFEKYGGHRQGLGLINIGGLREDLPYGWAIEYQTVHDILFKNLKVIHKALVGQKDFRSRLEGADVDAQTVLQWGVSGPAMRAAGLNFDLRKSQPFYFYQDVDFDIPVGINGSAYDRYLIRLEEIFQSLRIITQVIDNLPLGDILILDQEADFSHSGEWIYSSLESPNGEAGFLHLSGTKNSSNRIKIKTPSFALAQAVPHIVKNITHEQVRACMASLGLRRMEIDR